MRDVEHLELEKAWKISEFSKLIDNKHYNTIDQWFKALEDKRIHYVNRVAGEKVYDQLDLDIGKYIKDGRSNNYNLQLIFDQLPDVFSLRPFPLDWNAGGSLMDYDELRREMEKRFEEKLQETREKIMDEVVSAATQLFEEHRQLLPPPKSREEIRAEEINDKMSRMKIEWRLEEQAIEEWTRLPESDRLRKVGLFRKEEDFLKRDAFIKKYIQANMESALKAEYGIT